jgi:uncharacterized small protein (DUF1192 family)
MNDQELTALAHTWTVETSDVRARVADAIGAGEDPMALLTEIRAMRQEMGELRRGIAALQHEIVRLRSEPRPRSVRLTPYEPTESLMRLS